ncbi:ATP-binding protein [Streptomyces sp. NPDC007355]|uniref:ATP-binding protein n=1 Tax=Streptomyces sp. NPDC007355 TaxID=3364778 RepID=UPI00367896A7
MEHRLEAVAAARHTTQQVLAGWQVAGERADAVVLVVSELVSSAVEHVRPPLALHLYREHAGGRVWVGVSGGGGPSAAEGPWTSSCAPDEHGCGLAIIHPLAGLYGTRRLPHGSTTRWARFNTASHPQSRSRA